MAKKGNEITKATLAGYLYYTNAHSPQRDDKRKKTSYKTDLVLTDENNKPVILPDTKTGEKVNMLKRAKELGLNIKTAKEGTKFAEAIGERPFVRIKREFKDEKMALLSPEDKKKKMEPIPVKFRKDFKALNADTMIGNGSFGVVSFGCIPYDVDGNEGVTAYLHAISVVNLISYQQGFDKDDYDFSDVEMSDSSGNAAKGDDTEEAFVTDAVEGDEEELN